jgi:hypothetical protein
MKRCNTVVFSVARTHSARAEQKLPGMAISAAFTSYKSRLAEKRISMYIATIGTLQYIKFLIDRNMQTPAIKIK